MPELIAAALAAALLMCGAALFALKRCIVQPDRGQALVITTPSQTLVSFTNRLVLPGLHRFEVMDLSLKTLVITRHGKDGLICADNIRADIDVTFLIRVQRHAHDIIRVAEQVGCARAASQDTLEALFGAKLSEALKTVGKMFEFQAIFEQRDRFRDEVIRLIGEDLNGYVIDDAAIDYLEQTPLEHLDRNNILDAQGIKKIAEITSRALEAEAQHRRERETRIGALELEGRQAALLYEREAAEAEARQAFDLARAKAERDAEVALAQLHAEHKVALARAALARELPPIPNDVRLALSALEARVAALEARLADAPQGAHARDNDAAQHTAEATPPPSATAPPAQAGAGSVEDARKAALRALGIADDAG